MSSRIRIQEHTSLNAIASWLQVKDEGLVFCVSSESGFAPLTEGVALGVLHDLARRLPVCVETMVAHDARTLERLPMLESLFGVKGTSAWGACGPWTALDDALRSMGSASCWPLFLHRCARPARRGLGTNAVAGGSPRTTGSWPALGTGLP